MPSNPMDDALEGMERTQARPSLMATAPLDWFAWRKLHHDLWIGATRDDGCKEEWQELLREHGPYKLTSAVIQCRRTGIKGSKIRLQDVLAVFAASQEPDSAPDDSEAGKRADRARMDLLIWCVIHSGECYADARCQWVDGGGMTTRVVPGYGEIAVKERICRQGTTVWEQMRDRAAEAQRFIFAELGRPISPRTKPAVYHTVKDDPRWIGYLRARKLIA